MVNEFGNINDMVIGQFATAVTYYKRRIAQMEADESLMPETKAFFNDLYTKKIEKLIQVEKEFKQAINDARAMSVFVNESTATLNSLGRATSNTDMLSTMAVNTRKHRVKAAFKIVGAIVLPVVGTIPFLISLKRQKQRFKEIKNTMLQENIDLQEFVNTTKTPYAKALLTKTEFTEEDMKNLLDNPAEITRLQVLLTSGTLNPIEKKNLTQKMVKLKEFAQKNKYTLAPGILSASDFNTAADKKNIDIANIQADVAAVPVSETSIANYLTDFNKLADCKAKAEALQDKSAPDATLTALISTIDTKTTTLKTNAGNFITNQTTTVILPTLASKKATTSATTKAQYVASNTDLKAYFDSLSTVLGADLADAEAAAEKMGLNKATLSNIRVKYLEYVSENDVKIAGFENAEKFKDLKTRVETIINFADSQTIDANMDINDLMRLRNENAEAEAKIEQARKLLDDGASDFELDGFDFKQKQHKAIIEREYDAKLKMNYTEIPDLATVEAAIATTEPAPGSTDDVYDTAIRTLEWVIPLLEDQTSNYAIAYIAKHKPVKYAQDLNNAKNELEKIKQTVAKKSNNWTVEYQNKYTSNLIVPADKNNPAALATKKKNLEEIKRNIEGKSLTDSIPEAADLLGKVKDEIEKVVAIETELGNEKQALENEIEAISLGIDNLLNEFRSIISEAAGGADKKALAAKFKLALDNTIPSLQARINQVATKDAAAAATLQTNLDNCKNSANSNHSTYSA